MALPEELNADPEFFIDNHHRWSERKRDIAHYVGPRPAKKNQAGRWAFWEGRTMNEVLGAARAEMSQATQPLFVAGRTRATVIPARCTPSHHTHTPPLPPHVVKEEEEEDDPDLKHAIAASLQSRSRSRGHHTSHQS